MRSDRQTKLDRIEREKRANKKEKRKEKKLSEELQESDIEELPSLPCDITPQEASKQLKKLMAEVEERKYFEAVSRGTPLGRRQRLRKQNKKLSDIYDYLNDEN